VQVTWVNRHGDMMHNSAVPLPPDFVALDQTAAYIPEYGQSYATAEYQIVGKLAKQVVGMMEQPW
ncbi:MAG TPA: hypothetical protein VGJ15_04615, partial [Pirellulales bacterium]